MRSFRERQRYKPAYCWEITRFLSCVLPIARKIVYSDQLSLQRFSKCLAELMQIHCKLVLSWLQVERKTIREITEKLCLQQPKRKPPE